MHANNIDELIILFLRNELTAEQEQELSTWINLSESNKALFEKVTQKKFVERALQKINSYDEEKGWRKVKDFLDQEFYNGSMRIQQPPSPGFRFRSFSKWAVAACILPFLIVMYWLFFKQHNGATAGASIPQIVSSPASGKIRLELPDHSVVILNKGSVISYNKDFGLVKREVYLKGEAYFDVKSNKAVPMIVIAGPLRIKEIGTAFNVRAYPDESVVETSLIHGEIQVSELSDSNKSILMHPNEKILWKKDLHQQGLFQNLKNSSNLIKAFQVARIKPNISDSSINELVWLQDKLIFSHEPFYALAEKMERWYRVSFVFKDESSKQLYLTGSLEKETLEEALEALSKVAVFDYVIKDKTVTIQQK